MIHGETSKAFTTVLFHDSFLFINKPHQLRKGSFYYSLISGVNKRTLNLKYLSILCNIGGYWKIKVSWNLTFIFFWFFKILRRRIRKTENKKYVALVWLNLNTLNFDLNFWPQENLMGISYVCCKQISLYQFCLTPQNPLLKIF